MGIQVRRLICTGDAEIAFAAYAQSLSGSAIVCHMGSTAMVAHSEKFFRYGGWGSSVGDDGSGHWIGIQAMRALGEEYDRGLNKSKLWNSVDQWLMKPRDSQYPDWTAASLMWRQVRERYTGAGKTYDPRTALFQFCHVMQMQQAWQWRAVVSSLVIPVVEAHSAGDAAATKILNRAARLLVAQYKGACKRAGVDPVCLRSARSLRRSAHSQPLVSFAGRVASASRVRRQLRNHYGALAGNHASCIRIAHVRPRRLAHGAATDAVTTGDRVSREGSGDIGPLGWT